MARDKGEIQRDIENTERLIEIKDQQAKGGTTAKRRSKHEAQANELKGKLGELKDELKNSR